MKFKILSVLSIGILFSLVLSACGGGSTAGSDATATPLPIVIADTQIVAEGFIVPKESAHLAFFTGGQVDEVLVEEGESVTVGTVIARLGNREQMEAAIAAAQSERVAARQARRQLDDDLSLAQADASAILAAANENLKDAKYALDNFTVPQNMKGQTPLEAIAAMKVILDEKRDLFEPYRYLDSGNETRKDRKEDLDLAQADYNTAVRWLQLETNLHAAEARLDKAMKDYEDLQTGPDKDLLESADARVTAAEANLAAAQANLDNLELKSTINGTVVLNDLIAGQDVTPGAPVVTVADFSELYAETDDLTEIEVVDISTGQDVSVVPDALPDLDLNGTVTKIDQVSEEKRGDITYTVRVKLDETDPRLRWGMTVVITFASP